MKKTSLPPLSRRTFLGAAGSVAATSVLESSICNAYSLRESGKGTDVHKEAPIAFHHTYAPAERFTNPLERPFRDSICLNGKWHFQPVPIPAEFRRGQGVPPILTPPDRSAWEPVPIRVPSPWNVNSFADHDGQGGDFRCFPTYPSHWETAEMGWLQKKIVVPAAWQGRCIQLHFVAVGGEAVVHCNGHELGKHFDLFLPFTLDVTDVVRCGAENEILVGIRKASLFDKTGPYGRRRYQGGSFWGQHIAGIWQDVHLVALPTVHASDVFVQPDVASGILNAEVTLRNTSANDVEVGVGGGVFAWIPPDRSTPYRAPEPSAQFDSREALRMPKIITRIPARGEVTVKLRKEVDGALVSWSPDHPNLYGLMVSLEREAAWADGKVTRFGWRQISFSGQQILLNGKPLILRGDSWHFMGVPQMTRRYAWAWFSALREAGLNTVRFHAQPYPQFYLDMADEFGVLVLDESAVWASDGGPKLDDPAFWADATRHIEALIRRDRNHPSVFGWSVCNEVWPIIRFIFRNPPGMMKVAAQHYALWAELCRSLDPTRPWISADGDEDGEGHLPVFMIHYGGAQDMDRAVASGKPWGIGETGNAYYGTPQQVAEANGDRAYESCLGRMEGVAMSSFRNLQEERAHGAIYRSVFNLVWYGLQPLPLGLSTTTQPPTTRDGVRLAPPVEGVEGMQPERLGPYSTTLNPGYDPTLPLYRPWPLFDAIRDASAEPPFEGSWICSLPPGNEPPIPQQPPAERIAALGGVSSALGESLRDLGVPLQSGLESETPQLLFVDGGVPPGEGAKHRMREVLQSGGTVVVWGPIPESISGLNALLPEPIALSRRSASSFLPASHSPLLHGLKPSNLYFCEQESARILEYGLRGPLIQSAQILLRACDTNWLLWNGQPEYAKTAMVYRSELERKPSGVVLAERRIGGGRLLVTTLPLVPQSLAVEATLRQLLTNLGIALHDSADASRPFLRTGSLVRALACGYFGENEADLIQDMTGRPRAGAEFGGRPWKMIQSESDRFDLTALGFPGSKDAAELFLSFWVYSPRDLTNLLLEPNLPQVNLDVAGSSAVSAWLNGVILPEPASRSSRKQFEALALRKGWNHLLLRLHRVESSWEFSARLSSSEPAFIKQLDSGLEGTSPSAARPAGANR